MAKEISVATMDRAQRQPSGLMVLGPSPRQGQPDILAGPSQSRVRQRSMHVVKGDLAKCKIKKAQPLSLGRWMMCFSGVWDNQRGRTKK
jgi:hypothetical protein